VNHFYQLNEDELALCSIVIWAVLDPANPFNAPSLAPFVIGLVSYIIESSSPPENRANLKDTDLPTFRPMPIWSGVSQTSQSPEIWLVILELELWRRSSMEETHSIPMRQSPFR
jgi:hypothetical protein